MNIHQCIKSLLVSHQCYIWRSWNFAASDNHLWEMQYFALYGSSVKEQPIRLDEDRNCELLRDPIDTRPSTDWREAVKRAYTGKMCWFLILQEVFINWVSFHIQVETKKNWRSFKSFYFDQIWYYVPNSISDSLTFFIWMMIAGLYKIFGYHICAAMRCFFIISWSLHIWLSRCGMLMRQQF